MKERKEEAGEAVPSPHEGNNRDRSGRTRKQHADARPSFSQKEIEEAKIRHNLAELIGLRVKLTKASRSEYKGQCPFHNEHTPSFTVSADKGVYFCFGCGAKGDALTWVMITEQVGFRQAVEILLNRPVLVPMKQRHVIRRAVDGATVAPSDEQEKLRKNELARKIWNESLPPVGTLVERYLFSRGIVFEGDLPKALRFHPSLLHEPSRQYYPAMVAIACRANGDFAGIHRTYLAEDGNGKANVPTGGVKRMLGSCFGGHVQLTTGTTSQRIAVAEGIETALSIAQSCPDMTVWAAMALGNLKAPVPTTAQEIILCADGDNSDPHMAERILLEAAREHMGRGQTVLVARPPQGMDFNDVLLAGSYPKDDA